MKFQSRSQSQSQSQAQRFRYFSAEQCERIASVCQQICERGCETRNSWIKWSWRLELGERRQDDKNYHLIGSRPAVATQRRRSKWDKHLIYGSAYAVWSCANEDPHSTPGTPHPKRRKPFRGETLAKYLQCRLIELVFNKRLPNFAFPAIPTEQQRAAESNLVGIYSYNLAGNLVNALCHYDAPCRSQRIRSFRFYNLSCTCRHLKSRKRRRSFAPFRARVRQIPRQVGIGNAHEIKSRQWSCKNCYQTESNNQ